MAKNKNYPINRIAELRKARGMTQQQLADAVGSHWITVSKLERGVMRLSDEWRELIARALGVDEWDLVVGARALPLVHVSAAIDDGGEVRGLDEEDTSESFHLSTDYFTNPAYRWVVVAGDALWPWYQDGDRLCVWNLAHEQIDDIRGRLCLVWLKNEDDSFRVVAGILQRGRRPHLHTIERFGMPPIRDVEIDAVAVVAMAVFYHGPQSFSEPTELIPPLDTDSVI